MNDYLQDPMFFYAFAFMVFLALAFIYGRKPIVGWLDAEIAKIKAELDHARHLRAEAEVMLASCKEKQAAAESDARAIVTHAQQQVEAMRKRAESELADTLKRHEQLVAERIRQAESGALAAVRQAAIDMALKIARAELAANISDNDAARLIDQAIADIPALKTNEAKAA